MNRSCDKYIKIEIFCIVDPCDPYVTLIGSCTQFRGDQDLWWNQYTMYHIAEMKIFTFGLEMAP